MCWNVTFFHHCDINIWTVWNFQTWPDCFRKYSFGAWIWTQILYFFGGNQESSCHLNQSHRVTRNTDSNYLTLEGCKTRSLTIRTRIWLGHIFLISRDTYCWIEILGKKTLAASYSRTVIAKKMCWKVTFGHRFEIKFWTVRNFLTWHECFRKNTFGAWIWTQILYFFFMEIKRVIVIWISPTELPNIRIPILCRWRGVKVEV